MFSSRKLFGRVPTDAPAYFRIGDGQVRDFILRLDNPDDIVIARRQANRLIPIDPVLHVTGIIVKETACWNPGYSYHYDPTTVDFFDVATEVCDAGFQYVEEHLAEAGGAFLPDLRLCPWGSYVIEEVTPTC